MSISITTPRLELREYIETDIQGVHFYAKDPETVRYMTWGPNTRKDTEDFIQLAITQQSIKPRVNYHFVVTLKESKQIIGGCGIHVRQSKHKLAEIGYCFAKQFWGQGYATETVGSLLEFGFEKMQIHRFVAGCDPNNIPSERVLQKNGLRKEAHFAQALWHRGKWRDSLLYAILDSEWLISHISENG